MAAKFVFNDKDFGIEHWDEWFNDMERFEAAVRRDEREQFVRAVNQPRGIKASDIRLSGDEPVSASGGAECQ